MVKKLFKHEFLAYLRTILPINLILIAVAVFTRVVQIFENDSTIYSIVFGSSIFIYIVGLIVSLVLTFIFGIRRFYANLFTNEGYLTLTLPVTSSEHIIVKFTVATVSMVFSSITAILSIFVVTFGDVCSELFKAFGFLFNEGYKAVGFDFVMYIVEFVVLTILSITVSYLLFYMCIAIGQRAKKNRVAAAIGVYLIYYAITQVISTVFTIFIAAFGDKLPLDKIAEFVDKHPEGSIHIALCTVMLFYCLIGVAYFAVSNHIIKKKLNLE